MINSFKLSVGNGKCIVESIIVKCGKDLNVTIGGGEKYHIGSVAIAVPRSEYKEDKKRTASTSVICVQGHKEDEVSYKAAKHLATALDCTVIVSAGLHIDDINNDELLQIMDNFNIMVNLIIEKVK